MQICAMIESVATRWLTYNRASHILFVNFIPILDCLRDGGCPAGDGYYTQLRHDGFLFFLCFFLDIFPLFAQVSLFFQTTASDIGDMHIVVGDLMQKLLTMIDEPYSALNKTLCFVQTICWPSPRRRPRPRLARCCTHGRFFGAEQD
jgi:hypothetical protein